MERLTQWFKTASDRIAGLAQEHEEKYTVDELIDVLLDKLARYEDTSMEPEEVSDMESRKLLDAYEREKLFAYLALGSIDHIQYLVQAEQDGRLVVLPCKEGTEVYRIGWRFGGNHVIEKRYFSLTFMRPERFGKDVFLTREEAEAALEVQKGENHETDSV